MRIASPEDGATVASPFDVSMEAEGFEIEPAGEARDGAGHFHVMVDATCIPPGETIPADDAHVHLAAGERQTELSLSDGEHTLCAQAGDGLHSALDATHEITITVVTDRSNPPETAETTELSGAERWTGAFTGTVTHDCGPLGRRLSTLEGRFTIVVADDNSATLDGTNTVTGSCAGATEGRLTTPITVSGERTAEGFELPAALWGPGGTFTIAVQGDRGRGTLRGEAPGPAVVVMQFVVRRT
jgi:hypothetical protein